MFLWKSLNPELFAQILTSLARKRAQAAAPSAGAAGEHAPGPAATGSDQNSRPDLS